MTFTASLQWHPMQFCCLFQLLLIAWQLGLGQAEIWQTANRARVDMEASIRQHAALLQREFGNYQRADGTVYCPSQTMCDPTAEAWTSEGGAQFLSQFNDPASGTCVALDLDYDGNFLANPITGRRLHSSLSDISFPFEILRSTDQCEWDPVVESWEGRGDWHVNTQSKQAALEDKACTDPNDTGLCLVNTNDDSYGVAFPDAGYMGFNPTINPCSGNICDGMADGPCGCDPCEACPEGGNHRVDAEICATNQVVPAVKQTQQRYPQVSWHFLGMQETGMYRTFPGIYQCRTENQCDGCSDPRYRGWYASAASGRKDVVVVIDTSSSMSNLGRITHAKTAASWVLNTLTERDFGMVVAFSDGAESYGTEMLPMNAVNRKILKEYIAGFTAHGETVMSAAFERAFSILNGSPRGTSSSGCSKVIIYLGDGVSDGSDPVATIRTLNGGPFDSRQDSRQDFVRIFTYGFGDTAAVECSAAQHLMKRIACENGGVFSKVRDSDASRLKTIMANYFVYLSAGMAPGQNQAATVKWVDIYEDGQGRGRMTAACASTYSYGYGLPSQLFGVVCLGLPIATAETLQGWDVTWASILSAQDQCQNVRLTWSQLESLRGLSDYTEQCAIGCSDAAIFVRTAQGFCRSIQGLLVVTVISMLRFF